MNWRRELGLNFAIWACVIGAGISSCARADAQPTQPSPSVEMKFTHAEIEANLNLINDAVKANGLAQPQRVQDALGLLVKFQTSLKADADARAAMRGIAHAVNPPDPPPAPNPDPPKKE